MTLEILNVVVVLAMQEVHLRVDRLSSRSARHAALPNGRAGEVVMASVIRSRPLAASVLVLNRYFLAVHVVGARRAFGLLYRGLAEVIQVENGHYANYDFDSWLALCELQAESTDQHADWVRAVCFEVQVPRIIRLATYDRVPRQTLRFNRRNLFARDNHSCQYCGRTLPLQQLSIDHVVPRSRGGATSWENVVCSCLTCNTRKGGRTPQEARMTLLSEPRRPAHNPLLAVKLNNPKYASWRTFLPDRSPSFAGSD